MERRAVIIITNATKTKRNTIRLILTLATRRGCGDGVRRAASGDRDIVHTSQTERIFRKVAYGNAEAQPKKIIK